MFACSTKFMHYKLFGTNIVATYVIAIFLSSLSSVITHDCETEFDKLVASFRGHKTRPRTVNDKALNVTVRLYLHCITSVNELNTEYSMQLIYRQQWLDERLKLSEGCTPFIGDHYHASNIWIPSVHVTNSRENNSLSKVSEGATRIRIDNDGQVFLSNRIHIKLLCKMQFHRYPLDKQDCCMDIESSALTIEKMALQWNIEEPIKLISSFYVTGFNLNNFSTATSMSQYLETGNFSKLVAKFQLQREFGHFVLDIYIPSVLFVVTSWTSFWVEIPAAPARVTLGITTMLTLITSEKSVREKLPKMSYVHALDIWNVVCTGFIFASLVEYALVNYIYHKDKRRKPGGMRRFESSATFASMDTDASSSFGTSLKAMFTIGDRRPQFPGGMFASRSFNNLESATSEPATPEINCGPWIPPMKLRPQDIANGIDRKCRVIFPIGFVIFNIIYWTWTLLWV